MNNLKTLLFMAALMGLIEGCGKKSDDKDKELVPVSNQRHYQCIRLSYVNYCTSVRTSVARVARTFFYDQQCYNDYVNCLTHGAK